MTSAWEDQMTNDEMKIKSLIQDLEATKVAVEQEGRRRFKMNIVWSVVSIIVGSLMFQLGQVSGRQSIIESALEAGVAEEVSSHDGQKTFTWRKPDMNRFGITNIPPLSTENENMLLYQRKTQNKTNYPIPRTEN